MAPAFAWASRVENPRPHATAADQQVKPAYDG